MSRGADIGAAVADRLRRVQGAINGGTAGQCADPTYPSCLAGADGFASPSAGTVGLCPLFFNEPIETQTNTLLHEGMHRDSNSIDSCCASGTDRGAGGGPPVEGTNPDFYQGDWSAN